jgi:hypothetical protein
MTVVVLQTKGGPLTDDDFVGDAPPIGSSDKRYSVETLKVFRQIEEEFRVPVARNK